MASAASLGRDEPSVAEMLRRFNAPLLIDGVEHMPPRTLLPLSEARIAALQNSQVPAQTYHRDDVLHWADSIAKIDDDSWTFKQTATLYIKFGSQAELECSPLPVTAAIFPCAWGDITWSNDDFELGPAIQLRDWYLCVARLIKPHVGEWALCGFRRESVVCSRNDAERVKYVSHFYLFHQIKGAKKRYQPRQFVNLFVSDVTLSLSRFYPAEMHALVRANHAAPASWEIVDSIVMEVDE